MANRLIVSAERNAGKTTTALAMAGMLGEKAESLLTVSMNGKKDLYLRRVRTGEERLLMSDHEEIGPKLGEKYHWSEETFNWAYDILSDTERNVIMIDEVGKLELQDEGFARIIRKLLATDKDIILFVRWLFVSDVMESFDMWDADLRGAGDEAFMWTKEHYGSNI